MAKVRFDMVAESSTTTGTGAITLGGAKNPGRTFATAGVATSDTFKYRISHDVNNEWEIGTGTLTSSTTFTRSVIASSNANALVNFSAGNKTIELVLDTGDCVPLERAATDTVAGLVELATIAEGQTGTDTARAITAAVLAAVAIRSVNIQVFTASGTYTPTAGMKFCIAIGTGSGGGSGGADATATNDACASGGGSAGGTCIELFTAAQIGASQAVTIGAAGTAGSNAGGNGGTGGNVTLGSLFTATGGNPGNGTGTVTNSANVATGGLGPTPTGGLINIPGGDGGDGIGVVFDGTIDASIGISGQGGSSFWGGGGKSQTLAVASITTTGSVAGVAGKAPGSGASGAVCLNTATGVAGAVGATGILMIIEFM